MQVQGLPQKLVFGAMALAIGLAMPGTVSAQNDDSVERDGIWNLEQRIWGGFVRGLGLRDPNAPDIDYRERAPLVIPPSRDLPAPQARATPRDPAWPVDPDVAKAKKQAAAKKKYGGGNAATAFENRGTPISPDELNKGRTTAAPSTRPPGSGSDPDGGAVSPSELGYFGGLFSLRAWGFSGYQNETGTFTNEPARGQLTDPPPGYQTPSPDQPYGVTRRVERTAPKAFDPAGRY